MKNKNIKNKPKNVIDGFSCILDFPKFSGGGPPNEVNTTIKYSNSFFNNNRSQRQKKKKKKKEPESPLPPTPPPSTSPLKQSTSNSSLGYTEIEKKEEGTGARSFLCDL